MRYYSILKWVVNVKFLEIRLDCPDIVGTVMTNSLHSHMPMYDLLPHHKSVPNDSTHGLRFSFAGNSFSNQQGLHSTS